MAWSTEQLNNAAIIYRVGRSMGMSARDIQIGIITAMVESNLVNVNYGDRDSLGLFQQRPSQGWGSATQVLNPEYAASKFFDGLRGLGERRFGMGMGAAAQAVQRSAFPDRYAERIADMRSIWPRIAAKAGENPTDMDGNPYGSLDPATGEPRDGQDVMPEQLTVGTDPAAESMLGAFVGLPAAAPDTSAVDSPGGVIDPRGSISPATNEHVIKPLSQEFGGFEKGVDGWRKAVVEIAQRYLGTPYVWGGTDPNGFDCSGLLQYVYRQVGINLPRVSYAQAGFGNQIGLDALRTGDLVAWDNSSRNNGADHIAMYIGNGMILEAPRSGLSVRIRKLDDDEGAWGVRL